jgi:pyruvate kinase
LAGIRGEMMELEAETLDQFSKIQPFYRQSARNLIHYLALRRHDIRGLQDDLASLALSSLGRAESHVKLTLEMLLCVLQQLAGKRAISLQGAETMSLADWNALLSRHTEACLGRKPASRSVRIMVTMPSEAADHYSLVRDLLAEGMDCMRINCAHDGIEAWERMISNLHRARKETAKRCRVLMDLPGPKLRTGPIEPGEQVVKWRPHRNAFGRVIRPARIWLTPATDRQRAPSNPDACLPVTDEWVSGLKPRDIVRFFDTRGASRSLSIIESIGKSCWAESYQTAYVTPGTMLYASQSGASAFSTTEGRVGDLPASDQRIVVRRGDTLILSRDLTPGVAAAYDEAGRLIRPARIGTTLPQAFACVRADESIWLDDGRIGGTIRGVGPDCIEIEITHTGGPEERVLADKGINLPDSRIELPALTQDDLSILEFIASNADLVGYSFVRRASDVYELQDRLAKFGPRVPGIVLKIETRTAFEQLPALLLAAMRSPSAGVMIARGDLAVECGYERMAEVQEELLWICEAAHIPVVWATQVLESLAKQGVPSRAEITDAAMGERAECVMLNKGPYAIEAVRALDDILRRMEAHQTKKRAMLRSLKIASRFSAS